MMRVLREFLIRGVVVEVVVVMMIIIIINIIMINNVNDGDDDAQVFLGAYGAFCNVGAVPT